MLSVSGVQWKHRQYLGLWVNWCFTANTPTLLMRKMPWASLGSFHESWWGWRVRLLYQNQVHFRSGSPWDITDPHTRHSLSLWHCTSENYNRCPWRSDPSRRDSVHCLFFGGQEPLLSAACRILVPRPGMEPVPPAVEARSLDNWTAGEVCAPSSLPHIASFCIAALEEFTRLVEPRLAAWAERHRGWEEVSGFHFEIHGCS